jgi:hypothetical protein
LTYVIPQFPADDEREAMREAQDGECNLCGQASGKLIPSFNPYTGECIELLCNDCRLTLMSNDWNPDWMRYVADHLEWMGYGDPDDCDHICDDCRKKMSEEEG